jgi:hypothetical protein
LQDVFGLSRISHLATDETAQPRALTRYHFSEAQGVGGHGGLGQAGQMGQAG